jgi:hypothetical protein
VERAIALFPESVAKNPVQTRFSPIDFRSGDCQNPQKRPFFLMPFLQSLNFSAFRPWMMALMILPFALTAQLHAADILKGDVTSLLGPSFFIDDATNGGVDTDVNQPSSVFLTRSFGGLLTANQGPTRVSLTGFGFALHTSATANDASTVTVAFTYLGADEVVGGSDDVSMGSTSGTLTFTSGGEYYFAFDAPLTANLDITGRNFRIVITPSNLTSDGSLKIKSQNLTFAPFVSVAGVASTVIVPQRVNLAKFQTVTPSSVSGNRLASYATDGDAGNDSHWLTLSGGPHTARIDFPFPIEVGSAHVFMGINDASTLAAFNIQYLDGSTWTTIPGASVTGNTNVERNLVFTNPITAASFRISSTDSVARVREFALFPPNGPSGYPIGTDVDINLIGHSPAVASSHTTGNFPINAVDGRTHATSSWQTTTAGVNTLDIDLLASTKIGSAHLYSGSSTIPALASFTLKSWNGTAWVDIPGGVVTGNTILDQIITFTTPPTTNRVRLEFTHSGTTPSVVRELQIFPANTGNVGYPLGTNINSSGAYAAYETYNDAFHQITNVAANREIGITSGGQPALKPTASTLAQTQYQILLNHADGTYRLRNRDTGECLAGAQLSMTAGLTLNDEPYLALPHQDWILEPITGARFRIINAWSGLAIDTQGGATTQGTALVQNTVSSANSQQWTLDYDTWAPKKGLGHGTAAAAMNAKWNYNWGPTSSASLPSDLVFNPMQWGNFNWTYNTGSGPIWQHTSAWRKRGDGMILMGFNEPDRTDQSNITVTAALDLWPRVMALNQPLVGPAPADNGTWLTTFTAAANDRGFRWEYTGTHAYPGPSNGSSNGLINDMQSKFNTFGLPVWLTEFSFVDWAGNQSWSEEDNYQTLAEFLWRAESFAPLRKYALFIFTENDSNPQPANSWANFTPAPRSNSYDKFGNLTAFGKLYAAWDSDTTVRANKTYLIHHRGLQKRMANAATGNTNPGGRTIRTDGSIVNWTLVSTGTPDQYYIVSSIDGRRLSHTTGTGVTPTLAAAGTTGVNVQWSLAPTVFVTGNDSEPEKGWYHIVHSSGTRLALNAFDTSNNVATYRMVASTTIDNTVQWRFITPLPGGNVAPALAAIPDQVTNELTALTFTATATDATLPGGPVIYSILNPIFGVSINSSTGVFTWTPSETQGNGSTYQFTIRATDGQLATEQVVNITANEVNQIPSFPVIPNQAVAEGSLLTFTATATDNDIPANTLTFSLVNPPPGATIDGSTGVFTWTPTEAQGPATYTLTVRVNDGFVDRDRTVSVNVTEVTTAPILALIPPQAVSELTQLTFTASATDADLPANSLTYSLLGAPSGATIVGSTGAFTWTPTEAQGPGSYNFTVRVSDGSLTHSQPVSVTVNEVNVAPVLAAITSRTVNELSLLTFTASATDADLPANTLTYSLVDAPSGASIVGNTGVFTWTPTVTQGPGTYNFNVRVSDGALTHDRAVAVTVNEVNTAPVLALIPPQTVDELALLTFTASATDADLPANALTYSLVGAPAGATIVPNTGVFTWTPTEAQGPGTFNFTVRVSDGNLTDDEPVVVTVGEVNIAPFLAPIAPRSVSRLSLLTFTASATDADLPANTLTYSLISPPPGAVIDSGTGIFTWTPAVNQDLGVVDITVRVSDGDLNDDLTVAVTVNEVNTAPVLAAISSSTLSEGSLLTFTASATDADVPTNTLTYSLVNAPSGASIDGTTGVFTWTPAEIHGPGVFNFTVRVSDGELTHDQPVMVTVTDDSGSDVLGTWILSGQSNAEGSGITETPISGLLPATTLATLTPTRSDLNVVHANVQMFVGANDLNNIPNSAGASLPPRDTWHAMTAREGLAFDWGSGRGNESHRRFGPELAFGYDVERKLGSPIAIIKYARGASSIAPSSAQSGGVWRDFDPSDAGRLNQYDKLISTIQGAVNNLPAGQVLRMRGVLWMQGEHDALVTAMASAYQANLTEFITALRADIGAIAAASGGKLITSAASWSQLDVFVGTVQNTSSGRQTVINAQNAVAAAVSNVFIVDGTNGLSSLSTDDFGGSGFNYDTAGQVMLGERFADAAISRVDSGVLVSESAGNTNVTEGGATDSYTLQLTRPPSANVTINITAGTQLSVSPTSLTFTTVDWSTPQTVSVTAVDDSAIEGNHIGTISHSLSSSDLSFGGLPITGVTVSISDNDANLPPVLSAIPFQSVRQGNLLTFTATGIDSNLPPDPLTYSLIGAPIGAVIHPTTGIFAWTPDSTGNFNFTARVSDGTFNSEQPVSVTVEIPLPSAVLDSDNDGLADLLEYAFATSPSIPNANPFRFLGINGNTVTFEFPWNWQATGLSWQIRHGPDLSNVANWPVLETDAITRVREGNIDRITLSPPMTHTDRCFYVLEVIGN